MKHTHVLWLILLDVIIIPSLLANIHKLLYLTVCVYACEAYNYDKGTLFANKSIKANEDVEYAWSCESSSVKINKDRWH